MLLSKAPKEIKMVIDYTDGSIETFYFTGIPRFSISYDFELNMMLDSYLRTGYLEMEFLKVKQHSLENNASEKV